MKTMSTLFFATAVFCSVCAKADALNTDCLNAIELARLAVGNQKAAVASVDDFQNDLHVYDQMYQVIAKETNPETLKLDEQGANDQWQQVTVDFSAFRSLLSNSDAARVGAACGLAD